MNLINRNENTTSLPSLSQGRFGFGFEGRGIHEEGCLNGRVRRRKEHWLTQRTTTGLFNL